MSLRRPINWFFLINSIGLFVLLILLSLLIDRELFSPVEGLFVRKALVCSVAAYATQVVVRRRFFSKMHYHPLLIMGWYFFFGLFKCLVIGDRQIEDEIYIGAYTAITLILLESLINDSLFKTSWHHVLDIIKLGFLLVPFLAILQYLVGMPFMTMVAWVRGLGLLGSWLVYIVVALLLLYVLRFFSLTRYQLFIYETKYLDVGQEPRNWLLMVCLVLAAAYYPVKTIVEAKWLGMFLF